MSSPLTAAAVICAALLLLCGADGRVLSEHAEIEDLSKVVDSVRVVIVSKQDDDGKWVNEVKLEHGTEQAPWKVEVEQKTLERGGQQYVELVASLTGPKPAPQPTAAPRLLVGRNALPTLDQHYNAAAVPTCCQPPAAPQYSPRTLVVDHHGPSNAQPAAQPQTYPHLALSPGFQQFNPGPSVINTRGHHSQTYPTYGTHSQQPAVMGPAVQRYPGPPTPEYRDSQAQSQIYPGLSLFASRDRQSQPFPEYGTHSPQLAGEQQIYTGPSSPDHRDPQAQSPIYPGLSPFESQGRQSQPYPAYGIGIPQPATESQIPLGSLPGIRPGWEMANNGPYRGQMGESGGQLQFSWQGSQYVVHSTLMDWVTANKTCADAGTHLAVINSDEEASFLTDMLNRVRGGENGAFVGITDEGQEGNWVTIDGLPIASAGFARWYSIFQPDNDSGNENCGSYYAKYGGLNDVPCTGYLTLSICEKEEGTTEQTPTSFEGTVSQNTRMNSRLEDLLPSAEDYRDEYQEEQENGEPSGSYVQFPGFSSSYKVHTEQIDWKTANRTCIEEGAHLAIINSEEEAIMLANVLRRDYVNSYRGAFVGITDEAEEGTWLTIFGETTAQAGFSRWFRSDQPDNANGDENCGAIFPYNGGFNDVPCKNYLMHSICEKDDEAEKAILRSLESTDSLPATTTPEPEEIDSTTTELPTSDTSEDIVSDNLKAESNDDLTKFNDPTLMGYNQFVNNNYYKLYSNVDKNWQEAQEICADDGGALALVDSSLEFHFFLEMLTNAPFSTESLAFAGFGNKNVFDGLPEDVESKESSDSNSDPATCGAVHSVLGGMLLVPCHSRLPFICEINLNRDAAGEDSTLEAETSEEFDNMVDLQVNSLLNSDESVMAVVNFGQERDGEITAKVPIITDYDMYEKEDLSFYDYLALR